MSDRADDSAHLEGAAISGSPVSDHESDTEPVTRWAETYRDFDSPSRPDPAFSLSPSPTGRNEGTRVATAHDPVVLIAEAEAAGAGRSAVAVVAQVRPELLVVDLDGCADRVLGPVIAAACETGATLAYLANSGSPNSRHVAFAVTPAGRAIAAAAVTEVRRAHELSANAVDIRSPRHYLRFPGSASLKGGDMCWPVTVEGEPMTAVATAKRLRAALATVEDAWSPRDVADHYLPETHTPDTGAATSPIPPHDSSNDAADPVHLSAADVESPYAWKPRRALTDEESKLLNRHVAEGSRSDEATRAAREVLIAALNIRSWRAAKWYYDRFPVFAKFRERDDQARAKGRRFSADNPSLSFTHWSSVITTFRNHRAPVCTEDRALIDRALAEVAQWDDADLVAAAVAVVHNRFSDGHGVDDRPISHRCLAAWLNVDHSTAGRRIKGLIDRGLLELVVPHSRYTARQEAHRYRLHLPSPIYRTGLHHDLTSPRVVTHPLWGDLGQSSRHIWQELQVEDPLSTAQLASRTGVAAGTASYGAKRVLDALAELGLAKRLGRGRGTTWTLGPASLDEVAEELGTVARHRLLLAAINVEREAWHTTSPRTRTAARERLSYLHRRQHQAARAAPGQLHLFAVISDEPYGDRGRSPHWPRRPDVGGDDGRHVPGPPRVENRSGLPPGRSEQP